MTSPQRQPGETPGEDRITRAEWSLRIPPPRIGDHLLARAAVAWGAELAANRSSARAKSQLRAALLERMPSLGEDGSREQRTGQLAVLASRGIDALDGYFSLYLPQLF